MATNRADTLDPALLRPGRLDRKIEFPTPSRREKRLIFQTVTSKMNLGPDVDLEDCTFNGLGPRIQNLPLMQMYRGQTSFLQQRLLQSPRQQACKQSERIATSFFPLTLRRLGRFVHFFEHQSGYSCRMLNSKQSSGRTRPMSSVSP
jgi:hypothetical protein